MRAQVCRGDRAGQTSCPVRRETAIGREPVTRAVRLPAMTDMWFTPEKIPGPSIDTSGVLALWQANHAPR